MENDHSPLLFLHLLFLFFLTTLPITNPKPIAPSPSHAFPPNPTPPPPLPQQLNNIIDALIGAGDFTSWVSILSMANPTVLPLSATLFIPEDNTLDLHHPPTDPFLFPYHIVPQRLTFSELVMFNANTRLPTLLPGKSISITQNSHDNFTLDDTPITHPDLYATATLAVHGVASVLDYSVFGDGLPETADPTTPEGILSPPFMPIGETIGWRSGASACSSCTRVKNLVFLIFCWVFFGVCCSEEEPSCSLLMIWFLRFVQEFTFGCIACVTILCICMCG